MAIYDGYGPDGSGGLDGKGTPEYQAKKAQEAQQPANVRDQSSVDYGNGITGTKGADGQWYYPWRSQGYQDVLSDSDVSQQQQLQTFRQTNGGAATADDDKGALAQMNGTAPLAGSSSSSTPASPWTTSSSSAFQSTTQPAQPAPTNPLNTQLQNTMYDQAQKPYDPAYQDPRNAALYNTLLQRSSQSLNIDPNDPIIAAQVGAYRAEQQRGARDGIDAMAEASGPFANGDAMRRLSMEHAAQNTGAFQASLMGRELEAKRAEIQSALSGEAGLISQDTQIALQRQLALLDNAIKEQSLSQNLSLGNRGYDIQEKLGVGGLNNDLMRALLQNNQYYSGLNSQNDQFAANLGLNAEDRARYWDSVERQ